MPTYKVFLGTYFGWLPSWGQATLLFAAIVISGIALQGAVVHLLDSRVKSWHPFLQNVFRRTRRITRFVIILFAVAVALPLIPLSKTVDDIAHRIIKLKAPGQQTSNHVRH